MKDDDAHKYKVAFFKERLENLTGKKVIFETMGPFYMNSWKAVSGYYSRLADVRNRLTNLQSQMQNLLNQFDGKVQDARTERLKQALDGIRKAKSALEDS